VSESKSREPEEEVTLGALVEVKASKTRGAVIGVRVSPDLLARLSEYAAARGLTVSEVVRRGAEWIVDGGSNGPVYHTGVNLKGVGLVYGGASGSMSQTATIPPEADKDHVNL
jgi:ribbon-helix-helix CopG family protein